VVLRVPLIIKWPASRAGERRTGGLRREPTSALDLAVTVLAAAGLDTAGLPGKDLWRPLAPQRVLFAGGSAETIIAGARMLTREGEGEGDTRLLLRQHGIWRTPEAEDPQAIAELATLLDKRFARAQRARAALERRAASIQPPLSEEERARLRALGYTGS